MSISYPVTIVSPQPTWPNTTRSPGHPLPTMHYVSREKHTSKFGALARLAREPPE